MSEQYEIKESMPLLDDKGDLVQKGYAKKLIPVYDKSKVKGGKLRLKEWDYYYVGNDRFGVALTIADNSYMGLDSISFLSFEGEPWEVTKSKIRLMTRGKTNLPESSEEGCSETAGKGYAIQFTTYNGERHLVAYMEKFKGKESISVDIKLREVGDESIVVCTPFEKKGHFYYNQKINCMRASGTVIVGSQEYELREEDSFGILDWGRGVWTYHNTWYWGSASGLVDGEDFGFNIGYGFGDTSAASENVLFYRGKAHKLSQVVFNIPYNDKGKEDYMAPWTFTSDDGRFEMDFKPVIDRHADTNVGIIRSNQHQVFGKFTGKAVLDDGTVLEVKDFMGFAEKVENKW